MTDRGFAARRWILFAFFFLFALVALAPLRWALDMFGFGRFGLAARQATGSVWLGALNEAQLGPAPLGDVQVRLNRLPLLIGRSRLSLRRDSADSPLEGAATIEGDGFSLDDFTGQLRLGVALSPLPVGSVDLDDVSVKYSDGVCQTAEGRVRAQLATELAGLSLASGLSGNARCGGGKLLLPLASQSGMERLNLSFDANGRYRAELSVTPTDPALQAQLIAAGFRPSGPGLGLRIEGIL
jgi:general secretion pathway protein N